MLFHKILCRYQMLSTNIYKEIINQTVSLSITFLQNLSRFNHVRWIYFTSSSHYCKIHFISQLEKHISILRCIECKQKEVRTERNIKIFFKDDGDHSTHDLHMTGFSPKSLSEKLLKYVNKVASKHDK